VAQGRETRAELVETMAGLLREQSYSASGRAQLLAECGVCGVSNGSLYRHFSSGTEEVKARSIVRDPYNNIQIN
jgi:AcrR family transcriptional regulator